MFHKLLLFEGDLTIFNSLRTGNPIVSNFKITVCSFSLELIRCFLRHVLASGSVDQTVLLWDLSNGSVASTLKAHKEKIQALQWHPFEAQTLLTGCCDQ